MLEKAEGEIKNEPGKLATLGTQDETNNNNNNKTQHDMGWTPLYVNKHK